MYPLLEQNIDKVKEICLLHKVKRLYVFGSVCTEKFNIESDIDFIVGFETRFFDDYVNNFLSLEEQLKNLLNREIDLVAEETIQNPYFISVVNQTKTPIYE
jgi:predicted nucleotidyltransferase